MENLYVLKFGGNAIRGRADMMRLSAEMSAMAKEGRKLILVHGGGPEISEEMERRGLSPVKVCGVRVTDADALDVAENVLRRINADMVGCLRESGADAVGIPGYFCSVCEKKAPMKAAENGEEKEVDLGLVGEVSDVDPQPLFDLLAQGIVPVIYPIGKDASGRMLNVNADTMAAGIAAGTGCAAMIAITDVPGILRDVSDPSSRIESLTADEARALIRDGTISGGMIPKVEACIKALESGIPAVRMVNGKDESGILAEGRGTVIKR